MNSVDDRALTAIEISILRQIALGAQSKEIAVNIKRSKPTVESYVRLLCAKFGARSRAHLIALAVQNGCLSLETTIADRS